MNIRKYRSQDCEELIKLFYETVHAVNAMDYTREQLDAWAVRNPDAEAWNRSLTGHTTLVAVWDERIVGFGDIDETGYLDRLFVHKDYQRRGIASALCDELEKEAEEKIVTYASVTARLFFEKRGYQVVKKHQAERHGVFLTNYLMEKQKL